jgi:hypothetical protein
MQKQLQLNRSPLNKVLPTLQLHVVVNPAGDDLPVCPGMQHCHYPQQPALLRMAGAARFCLIMQPLDALENVILQFDWRC